MMNDFGIFEGSHPAGTDMKAATSSIATELGLISLLLLMLLALVPSDVRAAASGGSAGQCPESGVLMASDSDYGQQLVKSVKTQAFYLETAARAGQTGTAVICVRANRDKTLGPILIEHSSGYPMLDGSALYATGLIAAKNAGRMRVLTGSRIPQFSVFAKSPALPAPPDSLLRGQDGVWIRLPISFKLEGESLATEREAVHLKSGDFDPLTCHYLPAELDKAARSNDSPSRTWPETVPASRRNDYYNSYSNGLSDEMFYPGPAQAAEIEGATTIEIAMLRNNSLICASVAKSSGEPLLDGAALISIGLYFANGKVPPIPAEVDAAIEALFFSVPINFRLK